MALTTRIDELVEKQEKLVALATTQKSNNMQRNQSDRQFRDKNQTIAEWRMNKTEEKIEKDGKIWYWCPKHVVKDKYDGLYVTHKPEDHEEWRKRREAWRSRKTDNRRETESGKYESGSRKLVLSENLKAALLTKCELTSDQADRLIKEAQIDSDF